MGATIKEIFKGSFEQNIFGLITGVASATQFAPSGEVGMIRFKAHPDNQGLFVLGNESLRSFWLKAGDDTGWVDLARIQQLWYEAPSGSSDYLAYWLQR